jgi:hypothetical protein
LLAALVLLGIDGQLPMLLAWAAPGTLAVLAIGALVRQQRSPSMLEVCLCPNATAWRTILTGR